MSSLAVPSLAVPGAVPRGSRTRRSSSVSAPRLATDKRGASVLPSASAGKSPRRPRRDQFLLALVSIRAARSNRSREPLPLRSGPFPPAHRRSPSSPLLSFSDGTPADDKWFRSALKAAIGSLVIDGTKVDPSPFNTHSLRAGGATRLFELGRTPQFIALFRSSQELHGA